MKKQMALLAGCLLALALLLGKGSVYAAEIRQIPGVYYSKVCSEFQMEEDEIYRNVVYKVVVPEKTGKIVKICYPIPSEQGKISVWKGCKGKAPEKTVSGKGPNGNGEAVFRLPSGISYIKISIPIRYARKDNIRIYRISWWQGLSDYIGWNIRMLYGGNSCL